MIITMDQKEETKRAEFFSQEEQLVIMTVFEDYKVIIAAKSNTASAAKAREEAWQNIADRVNACTPRGVKRTWQQVKTKYKNIIQTANRKKMERKKMGAGLTPEEHITAEELAHEHNRRQPIIEAIPGGSSSDPATAIGPSTRSSFVKGHSVTLLETPVQAMKTEAANDGTEPPLLQKGTDPFPPTSRAQTCGKASGAIRAIYKRSLEMEMEYKKLKMRKLQLEIEQLEYEKRKRQDQ